MSMIGKGLERIGIKKGSLVGIGFAAAVLASAAFMLPVAPAAEGEAEKEAEAAGDNNLCIVCHMDLAEEEIAVVHLNKNITCVECHGPSNHHMHDEMLMTKPDRLFGRLQVKPMCQECHKHDPHDDHKKMEAFLEKWLGRDRPNGRVITRESICTDCHGTHNIVKAMGGGDKDEASAPWTPLFNGSDLEGWRRTGKASWEIKRARLIAQPGEEGTGGWLWSGKEYGDFLLSATFRAEWPIRAAIALRGSEKEPGVQVELGDREHPRTSVGTVWLPGSGPVLANLQDDLVSRLTWNTLAVKVAEGKVQVWLNGQEIGSVCLKVPERGRIGLHIEKHAENQDSQLSISELLIQPIEPDRKAGETGKQTDK